MPSHDYLQAVLQLGRVKTFWGSICSRGTPAIIATVSFGRMAFVHHF